MILPDANLSREQHEAQMAAAVVEARKLAPNSLVLAYSGSAHAIKSTMNGLGDPYRLAADQLPTADVTSVVIKSGPGTAWNCQIDTCGPHPFKAHGYTVHQREVVVGEGQEGVDATAYTGTATTASPPAVGPGTPVPIPGALVPKPAG
jgi:hypothetical protein